MISSQTAAPEGTRTLSRTPFETRKRSGAKNSWVLNFARCLLIGGSVLLGPPSGIAYAQAPPPNNVTFFSDPAPTVTTQGDTVILKKELGSYPNYGVVDGSADILYTGEVATWTFTIPASVDLSGVSSAFFRASLIADDHGVPLDQYFLAAWTNGTYLGNALAGLPHGTPFGSRFNNWVGRDYTVTGAPSAFTITLYNTSTVGNWFAIDALELHLTLDDGSAEPQILDVSTDTLGNKGRATLTVNGAHLPQGDVAASLTGEAQSTIDSIAASIVSDRTAIVTFDLDGAALGRRDLSLTFADGSSASLANAVTVVDGVASGLSVSILGPGAVRLGRDNSFIVVVRNDSANDAPFVSVGIEIQPASQVAATQAAAAAAANLSPYFIPAGGSITIPQIFRPDSVQCWRMRAEAEEEEECDPEEIEAALQQLRHQQAQVAGELSSLENNYASLNCKNVLERGPLPDPFTWVACLRWLSRLIELRAENARLLGQIKFGEQQLEECLRRHERQRASSLVTAVALTAAAPASGSGSASFCTVTSWDPNDKIGVEGVGPHRYIAPNVPLPYTIHFENQPTATAPAAEVVISDQLQPNLDWSTLSFGAITFGTRVIDVPAGSNYFRTIVDLRPDRELLVDVEGSVTQAGLVTVRFSSIDPLTGTPPTDPFAGFLPPNISSPEGEGSVSFTVSTRAEAPNGSQILNAARIVFDTNPALVTPQWINTVDSAKPMSRVGDLPAVQQTSSFTVTWSGSDEGSGLKTFDLFVSDNGAPFTLRLTDTPGTSATFNGQAGHTYAFFSIARDLVGNVEPFKTEADATTAVANDITPPAIVPVLTGTAGNGGWHISGVAVAWNVEDPESGIASTAGCETSNVVQDTQGVTLTCTATNGVGLSVSVPVTVKIDKTAPKVSQLPNLAVQQSTETGATVTFAPTVVDATSGVGVSSCGPASGSTFPVGTTTVTCTAADVAGNSAVMMFSITVRPAPDGRMYGAGHIDQTGQHHHFVFRVAQFRNRDYGRLEYSVSDARRCLTSGHDYEHDRTLDGDHDRDYGRRQSPVLHRFEATEIRSVIFTDDPRFRPSRGRQPAQDSVRFAGIGKWNGQSGYAFEVVATDQGEPGRNRDRFSLIVRNAAGTIVAAVEGDLDGGNVQTNRLRW